MPSRNRIPATIQMVKGIDDDLIAWYTSLPEGMRHKALKDALRAGLGLPASAISQASDITLQLGTEQVEVLIQELHREWEERTRQLVENLSGYIQIYVEQALNGHLSQSTDIDGAPQLSDAEMDQRKNKLKNAKW